MNVSDQLYLGANFVIPGVVPNPTLNRGVGPLGQIAVYDIVPLTKGTTNVATAQHTTASAALTLTAGTGVTRTTAPDGSGATVYAFDVPRAVSFTTSADMSAVNVTVTGYDAYGRLQTQLKTLGASATTVNTAKAFKSVKSIVASTTDGVNTVSVGSSDILGLPYAIADAGYLIAKWSEALAADAGTFVAAVTTDPATASTGDTRGTYLPSSASNGTRRLVVWMSLTNAQCGPNSGLTDVLGVTPA